MPTPAASTWDRRQAAEHLAAQIKEPESRPVDKPWMPQSLTTGAAGTALLHIERAHAGCGTWQQAHRWIANAVAYPISVSDTAGLYQGAPAIMLMLDAAAVGAAAHYRDARTNIDDYVAALAHRRVDDALERMGAGALPGFREYDVFFGMTGIGALLLRCSPTGNAMARILDYLVALTKPVQVRDHVVPGWWVGHDPHRRNSTAYRNGHGNFGMAHGICGPLALLSQALRRGLTVDGHRDAITTICAWLDAWCQEGERGLWWPEWITLDDLHRGQPSQRRPARPSWCYGTPGIARAGQLAGISTGDTHRQHHYEQALLRCLRDSDQQTLLTDDGLCHGQAGVYQTLWRAANDATSPELADHLPRLGAQLTRRARSATSTSPGFLQGQAGAALAMHTAVHHVAPISGWDTCLLID